MTAKAIIMTAVVAVIVAAAVIAALVLYVRTHKRCGYRPCGGDCESCGRECSNEKK
ncbi:MAG: FeoB-associated Cys-rich membrane protein [Oscillospiraceae bacterium]|nr:FeoB-associated Cys-rich membrane protein [Oscillospiraceae bacterium]